MNDAAATKASVKRAAEMRLQIREALAEVQRLRDRMQQYDDDIERSRTHTRAMLERLRTE